MEAENQTQTMEQQAVAVEKPEPRLDEVARAQDILAKNLEVRKKAFFEELNELQAKYGFDLSVNWTVTAVPRA